MKRGIECEHLEHFCVACNQAQCGCGVGWIWEDVDSRTPCSGFFLLEGFSVMILFAFRTIEGNET